ncbi:hypothetical protein RN001_007518 [Aquatica leii]|uniref:Gustatory receptor n=1 Tax=Aquatica leii TaxID=1421715 RepID=A0AAN7P8F5_9COLE|nr:hypothetical protein RN001_007518 [Aquatica leii]
MAQQILQNTPTYNIFMFIFSLGQFVGVLPLNFIENVKHSTMKFRWTSYKTVYSFMHVILLMCMVIFCVAYAQSSKSGWTFRHIVRTLFYISSLWGALSFFLITRKWPVLLDKWIGLDYMMENHYGFPKNMSKRARITGIVSILYGLTQILIFLVYNVQNTRRIASNNNVRFEHSVYFKNVFPQIFKFLPYSIFIGLIAQFTYIFSVWRMAYTDLLISFISSFLSIRFQQVTNRINQSLNKNRTVAFWREVREDYDRICTLCKEVDEVITNVVFVSYAANLMLLLVYLRYCTIVEGLSWEKIYNAVCFVIYLIRIFVISLYVSWINDESKEPRSVLNSVSTAQYNSEIQRFLQHISFNSVAFSGNKMFKVTRTLILNIGGIILTYELVLVQFSEFNFN